MIIGSRIGSRSKDERRLKKVGKGIFIAQRAYEQTQDFKFFDRSPLFNQMGALAKASQPEVRKKRLRKK